MSSDEILKMKYLKNIDALRIQYRGDVNSRKEIIAQTEQLVQQFCSRLNKDIDEKIGEIGQKEVTTYEELFQRYQEILALSQKKVDLSEAVFSSIDYAPELRQNFKPMMDLMLQQVNNYQNNVTFIEGQMQLVERSKRLQIEKEKYTLEARKFWTAQDSYAYLDKELSDTYQRLLYEASVSYVPTTVGDTTMILKVENEKVSITELSERKEILLKREKEYVKNLKLAEQDVEAKAWKNEYERKIKKNRLAIDAIDEKIFSHLLGKISAYPVKSYEDLEKRTKTIEAIKNARNTQVEKLYHDGIVSRDHYITIASKIDHTHVMCQLSNYKAIDNLNRRVEWIDSELETIQQQSVDLESLKATLPKKVVTKTKGKKKRKKFRVVAVQQAKPSLLKRIFNKKMKAALMAFLTSITLFSSTARISNDQVEPVVNEAVQSVSLDTNKDIDSIAKTEIQKQAFGVAKEIAVNTMSEAETTVYQPSIGDKIHLNEGSKIYATSFNAISGVEGYEVASNGLNQSDLYVTRGAILDQNGTPVYVTTDYGIDLKEVAKDIGLDEGSYSIALGCSSGDSMGGFVAVSKDKLNPNIEKGWVNASDPNLQVIEQVNNQLEKEGMVR